jgi:hypothetical protein
VKRLAADRSRWKSFVEALCSYTGDNRKWWWWWIYKYIASEILNVACVVYSFIYVYIIAGTHMFSFSLKVGWYMQRNGRCDLTFRSLLVCIFFCRHMCWCILDEKIVVCMSMYTVCPGSFRTVFIKNTRHELFSKFHSFYSK